MLFSDMFNWLSWHGRPLLFPTFLMMTGNILGICASINGQNLGPLVEAVVQKSCRAETNYHSAGGVLCRDTKSNSNESDPDTALRKLAQTSKQTVQALTKYAAREDSVCAGSLSSLGGTSVGPQNLPELMRKMDLAALDDAYAFAPAPMGMILSIPGITQVQYDFRALPQGPEIREFRITGRLEGSVENPQLRLSIDGNVEGDPNLYLEYSVNYKKTKKSFPAWSPFLSRPGDIAPEFARDLLQNMWTKANYRDVGVHRNGVQAWQEYEYQWHAERVGIAPHDIIHGEGTKPDDYALYPYGGDWVGAAWGTETRFKQTRRAFVGQFSPSMASASGEAGDGIIMSLNVKHEAIFYFHIDFDGSVTGRGAITYTVDPNLCALAVLTKQVNEHINMMKDFPAIPMLVRALVDHVIARFAGIWGPVPPSITEKVDEALAKLPRIDPAQGEADIAAFKSTNSMLPQRRTYALADIDVAGVEKKRLWGIGNKQDYAKVRLRPGEAISPPTPKDQNGLYAGHFQTRHGKVGWFEPMPVSEEYPDGKKWMRASANGWEAEKLPIENRRENEAELRIFEDLMGRMKGMPADTTTGTIKLYTQLPPCSSCAGVATQFSERFPGVVLVLTYGQKP